MKRLSLFLLFLIFSLSGNAQFQYGEYQHDRFKVHSRSSVSGATKNMTRNFAEFAFPDNCVGYIYRLSVIEEGSVIESLAKVLEYIPKEEVKAGAKLAKLILANNNDDNVDFFIFGDKYSVNSFLSKKGENHCKRFLRRIGICKYSEECMQGTHIYFAIRNNNLSNGVDILVEFMPLIQDPSQMQKEKEMKEDAKKMAGYYCELKSIFGANMQNEEKNKVENILMQIKSFRANVRTKYLKSRKEFFEKRDNYLKNCGLTEKNMQLLLENIKTFKEKN